MFVYECNKYSNGSSLTNTCNKEISKALMSANQVMHTSHMIGVVLVAVFVLLWTPSHFKGNGDSRISIKGILILIWLGSTLIGSKFPLRAGDDEFVHTFVVITVGCRFMLHLLSNVASLYIGLQIIGAEDKSSDILALGIIVYSILDFFVNMTNLGMWMLYLQMICESIPEI